MIKHVVTFRFRPEVTPEEVEAVRAGLVQLPASIETLLDYRVGADLGLNEGTGDFAVVATVADEAGLRAYLDAPEHLEVAGRLRALATDRLAVQFFHD